MQGIDRGRHGTAIDATHGTELQGFFPTDMGDPSGGWTGTIREHKFRRGEYNGGKLRDRGRDLGGVWSLALCLPAN